jgi:hypothetical protein
MNRKWDLVQQRMAEAMQNTPPGAARVPRGIENDPGRDAAVKQRVTRFRFFWGAKDGALGHDAFDLDE